MRRRLHHSHRAALLAALTAVTALTLRPASAVAPPGPGSQGALDLPGFTAEPSALLAAATTADSSGHDAVVLLSEAAHVFDAEGRSHYHNRLVVKIATVAGARDWTSWWCAWRPWREERPVLRARVITPDGKAHAIDPKTIEESALGEQQEEMFSDGRRIRAPLPAVVQGAVVEQECEHQERRPAIDGVVQGFYLFGLAAPTEHTRLRLDAPRSLPLRHVVRKLPALKIERAEVGDRVTLAFTMGRMEPVADGQPLLPSDVVPRPYVAWSVVPSWAAVASHYARLVEEKLAAGDLKDVAAAALAGRPAHDARDAVIAALLDRVHREVRYTGVELGDGAVVPRAPLDVLRQRFGDCKDQATLLVGLLRAVGIDANVALLRAGTGFDVERDLPDLGSFNHAIVFVPGATPSAPGIWIDPTERFARPGQLPLGDQGRWALVVDPKRADSKLVQTPVATAKDNSDLEEREIVLPESGRARVTERSTMRGSFEISLRARGAIPDEKKLRESLAGYAHQEYAADRFERYQIGDPDDLSKPMRMQIEASEARCGVAGLDGMDGAEVAILGSRIATPYLPPALRDPPPDPAKAGAAAGSAAGSGGAEHALAVEPLGPSRIEDIAFPEPFVVEWRYRVVPPPGFTPQPLPPPERRLMGPAVWSREFKTEANGVVTALFRFDTGSKRRLSPDEARGLRDGVVKLRKEGELILRFTQDGEAALAAGRIAEALGEFRRLAALHPKEALHHGQMARALLRGGLGDAARAEAQVGVALEPDSAAAHKTLALVLEHDLFGRAFHAGFDRAGAERELRRARQLAPDDAVIRVELAILDGYDDSAVRYSPRAHLDEAVREYRALETDLKEQRFRANLLFPLYFARRFDELKREARAQEASESRNLLLLAAVAATDGVAPAIDEAAHLESDPARRRGLLAQSAEKLIALRLYPQASALLDRAAEGANEGSGEGAQLAARARFLKKIRKLDGSGVPMSDPTWPVRELFFRLAGGARVAGPGGPRIDDLFALPASAGTVSAGPRALKGAFRRAIAGLPDEAVADLVVSGMEFSATGEPSVGFRVRAAVPGPGEPLRLYVVPAPTGSKAAYQILADSDTLWPLGRRAFDLARRGGAADLDAARRWLDWAREETRGGDDDPVAVRPFALLWSRGQSASAAEIQTAASALLADEESTAAEAATVLAAARERAPAEQRARYDLALIHASANSHRWADVLVVADRVAAREPDSEALFWQRLVALRRLDRTAEAEALARARGERFKDDPASLRALADAASTRADYPAVRRLYQRLIDGGVATPGDYNQTAWVALFVEPFDARAVELARQAVERSGRKRPEILHTLATLQAEEGRSAEAYQSLLESLEVAHVDEPRPHDWYVLGRIAEKLSLDNAALAAYRRAAASPDRAADNLSVAFLADRRLAAMQQKPAAPPAVLPAFHPPAPPAPAVRKSK